MNRYWIKGFIIVHGQKIHVIQDVVHAENSSDAMKNTKESLRRVFQTTNDVIELDNCVFEKDACSGLFVEFEYQGNAYSLLERGGMKVKKIGEKLKQMWRLATL